MLTFLAVVGALTCAAVGLVLVVLICARSPEEPRPAVLHCPRCSLRHVDRGEWAYRSHKTHLCEGCGHEWQPFSFPTVGISCGEASVGPSSLEGGKVHLIPGQTQIVLVPGHSLKSYPAPRRHVADEIDQEGLQRCVSCRVVLATSERPFRVAAHVLRTRDGAYEIRREDEVTSIASAPACEVRK